MFVFCLVQGTERVSEKGSLNPPRLNPSLDPKVSFLWFPISQDCSRVSMTPKCNHQACQITNFSNKYTKIRLQQRQESSILQQ